VILLAVVLLTLALADLIAGGLGGEPRSRGRAAAGLAVATVVATAALLAFHLPAVPLAAALVVAVGGTASWLAARRFGAGDPWRHPRLAVLALGSTATAALLLSGLWATPDAPGWLAAWLAASPFALAQVTSAPELLLYLAVVLFLSASANGAVRAALAVAGTQVEPSQQRLRGGRVIGVLERWLIFGLAVAGEPTAASLIISAKSLLRFPELSRVARSGSDDARPPTEVDVVTEYFLLGSLLSWVLALAPALLFWSGSS
jgi:hypothetical protein